MNFDIETQLKWLNATDLMETRSPECATPKPYLKIMPKMVNLYEYLNYCKGNGGEIFSVGVIEIPVKRKLIHDEMAILSTRR